MALEYSHEKGIVHRDIKPANVMITDQGDVKVMDFGIARALDDVGATLTSTWNVVGTAQYLSPEQALGESADYRSDIYSAGCLLYEVLTGRPPYIGDTPVSIAFQHVSGELIKPRSLNQNLPEGLDIILTVALAKKPEDRYQSAKEMLADIRKLRAGHAVTTKVARKPIKWRPILVAGLSAVIAGGLITYGVLNSSTTISSSLTEIPNVVGLTQPQAEALLSDFVVTVQRAHDGRVPKDRVASQVPLPTSKVKKGTGVILTLSDGPGDAIIPTNLVGMSLADARVSLAAAGLVISRTDPIPSDQLQGTILQVTPDAGSTIPAGSGVVLQIASGDIEVPSLVGVDGIQALTVLIQAGFLVNQIEAYDVNQSIGIVLAQAPEPGTTHTIGSSVTITINRAP